MLVSTEAFRLQALRLDALVFLRVLLESQDSTQMRKHIPSLVGLVQTAMNGDWYKIIAEAVRVAGIIVSVWRPSNSIMSPAANANIDGAAMIVSIYSALLPKLEALDIDQEIKECAVIVCGKMFAHVGDVLSNQLPHVLSLLQKRLENEILRIATLRTLAMIANSSLNLDMSNNINALLSDVSVFLRQQNRNLKVTSLNALSALLLSASSASSAQPPVVDAVFREVNAVIDDSDLNITALAVKLSGDVFAHRPEFRTAIAQQVYPTLLRLAGSSLLHGQTLDAVVGCLQTVVTNSGNNSGSLLLSTVSELRHRVQQEQLHKQSIFNISRCIVGICGSANGDAAVVSRIVNEFRNDLSSADDRACHLALLVVGDLGSSLAASSPESIAQMRALILRCFEGGSEDVKVAAAYSLGHLAVGDIDGYLPIVLEEVDTSTAASSIESNNRSRHQYFLLSALKELIISASAFSAGSAASLAAHLNTILPHLFNKFAVEDEGIRSLVSECVGSLANLHGEQIIPVLLNTAKEASTRYEAYSGAAETGDAGANHKAGGACLSLWTVISSVRFAVSRSLSNKQGGNSPKPAGSPKAVTSPKSKVFVATGQEELRQATVALVKYITFADLEVRKAAFLLVNACLHHNPRIAAHFVADVIPALFEAFTFKSERIVDLGPFKHRVSQ
jgi:cullin-associated NEDD8-dissociated protein 1